ncbi:TPA: hypothetical protein ACH3X1_002696 [Trebouxia sp. C0004]
MLLLPDQSKFNLEASAAYIADQKAQGSARRVDLEKTQRAVEGLAKLKNRARQMTTKQFNIDNGWTDDNKQQCGTSDVFLFYKGTAVFFHPQLRQHQQVPSLTELRGWLLMANEIMHLTVYAHHHTIQGGGVVDCITNLLRSAGVHNLLCSEEKSYYM